VAKAASNTYFRVSTSRSPEEVVTPAARSLHLIDASGEGRPAFSGNCVSTHDRKVSAFTQNQAFGALLFLYRYVLDEPFP
jgi:hypothetical protein